MATASLEAYPDSATAPADATPHFATGSSATFSQVLWSKIELAAPRLHAASDRFWQHPDLAQLVPGFLVQLYHVVRGGLALMAFAEARAAALPEDPAAAIAAAYFVHHRREEQDHVEWLLRDLAVMGVEERTVRSTAPLPSVVSLVGTQYFWIDAMHPCTLFGYLLVLEGSPPLSEQLDAIQRRTGLPPAAFRCLRAHGEEDPKHLVELNQTLDTLPISAALQQRIALSAFHTVDGVAALLDELLALPREPARHA